MQVTLRYGVETLTKTVSEGTKIGQLISDSNVKAVFGMGDNVRALINGVEMGSDVEVPNGATVVFETRCNQKAA